MPLYDYKCKKCGHVFEVQQKMTDPLLKYCPECKGDIFRLISASGVMFKGSGFYVTDSKGKKAHLETPKTEKKVESGTSNMERGGIKTETPVKETKNSSAEPSPKPSK